jgi:antitoxin (DNA-binding transcriptional repressor) of toxin-antitoxin stability system
MVALKEFPMQTIGIKELKTNPSVLTKAMDAKEYLLISKRGKPFALTTALDDPLFDLGLKTWLLTRAYADSGLSLGQLSRALDKSYSDTVKLLALLNIPVLDYDLADELDTLETLA